MDANQNRIRQKTGKLTDYTRSGGVFSFGYFSLDKQRKVPRSSGTKKEITKENLDSRFHRNDKASLEAKNHKNW